MATSPTPSLDSIRGGTNSIESYGEHNGYLSDSPLTLSGSSPPVSDSAIICDEFTSNVVGSNTNIIINQHHPISASVSSSSSASSASSSSSSASSTSSSSSGLSGCGSTSSTQSSNTGNVIGVGVIGQPNMMVAATTTTTNGVMVSNVATNVMQQLHQQQQQQQHPGVIGSNLNVNNNNNNNNNSNDIDKENVVTLNATMNGVTSVAGAAPRCTACKSKQSDAVAKCFECISYLCDNCVQAHKYMLCFNAHTVCHFNSKNGILGGGYAAHNQSVNSALMDVGVHLNNMSANNNNNQMDYKFSSSLTMMLQQQQQQQQQQQKSLTQLSKIVLNENNTNNNTNNDVELNQNQQQQQQYEEVQLLGHWQQQQQRQQQQQPSQVLYCQRHKNEILKFSCRTCCKLVCKDCIALEHANGHEVELIQEQQQTALICNQQQQQQVTDARDSVTVVQSVLTDLRGKVGEMLGVVNNTDSSVTKIKMQYQKAHNEITETYQFYCSMLDERKQELLKELEQLYNVKLQTQQNWQQRAKELMEKSLQTCESIELLTPQKSNVADVLILRKTLELQLQAAMQDLQMPFELEFVSNYQSIQVGVRNTFGYIRAHGHNSTNGSLIAPIGRPFQNNSSSNSSVSSGCGSSISSNTLLPSGLGFAANLLEGGGSSSSGSNSSNNNASNPFATRSLSSFDEFLPKRYQTQTVLPYVPNPYEKWSNAGSDNLFSASNSAGTADPYVTTTAHSLLSNLNSVPSLTTTALSQLSLNGNTASSAADLDLTSKLLALGPAAATLYPPKSQIKRHKMIYHCKFGEFGVMEGQFTEPSGVAVNAQNDIIVADTNNHRIQIFDKEGRFKFQFGECGKRDSQLLYPNRVAVVRQSGDIIVTERSPTHQIQIYNQYGQFVRKFGANILQHPRGVTVDNKGRIIVVECKVMRVIIFDQNGSVLHKFGCSKHLEFPNGVVVNDKQEIFISDNRAHCVKVFNYEGQYLRQIGGEGITNYPIGVGINANGDILIADNHNNFNLTIFKQDGTPVSALESKVKHAQCFDVALMDDGSVVLASKDYRLYIYRYVQVPPIGL